VSLSSYNDCRLREGKKIVEENIFLAEHVGFIRRKRL